MCSMGKWRRGCWLRMRRRLCELRREGGRGGEENAVEQGIRKNRTDRSGKGEMNR